MTDCQNEQAIIMQTVVKGHTFSVPESFDLSNSRLLGRGSHGVVATASDIYRNETIAIKRIRPYSHDEWDARHTLREIRLMKILGAHPNIIALFGLFIFDEKAELYMMMEMMDCDLHHVIQSNQILSEAHHKCFTKQILEGISAMHSIGVFHRDLKPGNILVSKDCRLRITDFGLARYMDRMTLAGDNSENPMTEYVVTRWYRSPELLLTHQQPYSESIDIWSIGCIIAELVRRKPLFPGKSHVSQVQLIFGLLGYSSPEELGFQPSSEGIAFLNKKCVSSRQNVAALFPGVSESCINFIENLLVISPQMRPTATQSLSHPFLEAAEVLYNYNERYVKPPPEGYFSFESARYALEELNDMIRDEVRHGCLIPPPNPKARVNYSSKRLPSSVTGTSGVNADVDSHGLVNQLAGAGVGHSQVTAAPAPNDVQMCKTIGECVSLPSLFEGRGMTTGGTSGHDPRTVLRDALVTRCGKSFEKSSAAAKTDNVDDDAFSSSRRTVATVNVSGMSRQSPRSSTTLADETRSISLPIIRRMGSGSSDAVGLILKAKTSGFAHLRSNDDASAAIYSLDH